MKRLFFVLLAVILPFSQVFSAEKAPKKEKVKNMCEVADRLENRGMAKGIEKATYMHISKGFLPAEEGAKELGISLEQLYENMEKAGYEVNK